MVILLTWAADAVTKDETLSFGSAMLLHPIISPDIFALRPDFTALSLSVRTRNAPSDAASAARLAEAIAAPSAPWAEPHLEAWREAYRGFGTKPNRFPCSAEALRKRALRDGALRPANAVVDLYNAVSLRFALPIGGEDAATYDGPPRLIRAAGSEPFQTMAEGQPKTETPEPGEVVWADAAGVTCRRWNWRQGTRTQLTEATTDMWFVLERLEPMPLDALMEAGRSMVDALVQMSPDAEASVALFDAAHPAGRTVQP